jgi:hypothetical protein
MSILDGPRAVVVLELVEAGREPTNPAYGQALGAGTGCGWAARHSQWWPPVRPSRSVSRARPA